MFPMKASDDCASPPEPDSGVRSLRYMDPCTFARTWVKYTISAMKFVKVFGLGSAETEGVILGIGVTVAGMDEVTSDTPRWRCIKSNLTR